MKIENCNHLKTLFADPPREYSAAPFWFLNDDMKPEELRLQLQKMQEKGIYECVVHPRKGLSVEYLSEDWFSGIRVILDEAKRLGMKIWIYDEQDWPSGYAGGKVIRENPEYAAQCLSMEKIIPVMGKPIQVKQIPGKKLVRVIAAWSNQKFYDITDQPNWASQSLCWEVFVLRSENCGHCPAYSDQPYVDLLNRDAVATFVRLTHSEYKKRFPEHWGSTIKGFFTDEPGFYQNYIYQTRNLNTIPWTGDFPRYFMEQCGYDLMLYIGALWDDMGDLSRKVRQDFYRVFTRMYNENFFKQLHDICDADGLQSIGHLHMEEHLSNAVQMEGSFLEDMRYLHIPGIDRIDRKRPRITEKLGSSAMHLYGRERCFSESYGCFGWGLTLQEMKAEADWQMVQGINMLVPHAFFSSIEGFRKTESPPSLFYQNPYWEHFENYAHYVRRLSFALSAGDYASDILVYYPITSCYEHFTPLSHYPVDRLDEQLITLCNNLQTGQFDFDFVDDSALAQRAVQQDDRLKIGNTAYRCVILPPVSNLPLETLSCLCRFVQAGGKVICTGNMPIHAAYPQDDEEFSERLKELTANENCIFATVGTVEQVCRSQKLGSLCLQTRDEKIKYMHRILPDGQLYFVINEDEKPVNHIIQVRGAGCAERLDPVTGTAEQLAVLQSPDGLTIPLALDGFGSALILIRNQTAPVQLCDWSVTLPDGSTASALGDWQQLGLTDYSGTLVYETKFTFTGSSAWLDLGKVCDVAQITVNGHTLGAKCWQPYRWDISRYLHQGENSLQVAVTNTLANALTEEKAPSGLYGPVVLK